MFHVSLILTRYCEKKNYKKAYYRDFDYIVTLHLIFYIKILLLYKKKNEKNPTLSEQFQNLFGKS